MKATEQYFPVVLFIMLYKVVLTFESVDEILWCDHSNESYWAVLSCGTVYYAVQGGSNFSVCGWNPKVWPFKWKIRILSSTFPWCLLCCATWLQLMLKCDHLEKNLLSSICNDTNIFKRALHSEMFMFIFLKFDSLWTPHSIVLYLRTWARFWYFCCSRAISTSRTKRLEGRAKRTIGSRLTWYPLHINGIIRAIITTGTQVAFTSTSGSWCQAATACTTETGTQLTGTEMTDGTLAVIIIHHSSEIAPMTCWAWEAVVQVLAPRNVSVSMNRTVNRCLSSWAVLSGWAGYTIRCS